MLGDRVLKVFVQEGCPRCPAAREVAARVKGLTTVHDYAGIYSY